MSPGGVWPNVWPRQSLAFPCAPPFLPCPIYRDKSTKIELVLKV